MAIVYAPLTPKNHRKAVLPDGRHVILGSTEGVRHWNPGPPPHVGWWNATISGIRTAWRWWDGRRWSHFAGPADDDHSAGRAASSKTASTFSESIEWSDYYPANARVPRIDPATGEPMPGLAEPMATPYVTQAQLDKAFPVPATDHQFGEREEVL